MSKSLSEKLKELRKKHNLSQEQLARKINVGISTIRNYEMEKTPRKPTPYIYELLSEALKVPLEYLMYDSITSIEKNNISIEKEIGLSECSIETLKYIIQDEALKDTVNSFIESDAFIQLIELSAKLNILKEYKNILYFLTSKMATMEADNNIKITNKKEVLKFIESSPDKLKRLGVLYNSYKSINITRHLLFMPYSEYEIEDNLKKAFLFKNNKHKDNNAFDNYLETLFDLHIKLQDYIELFEYRLEKTFRGTYQKEGVKNGSIRNNKK